MCQFCESGQTNSSPDKDGGNLSADSTGEDRGMWFAWTNVTEKRRRHSDPVSSIFAFLLKIADTSFVDCHL
jgi:hypothetical protein